jgi:hypothetical protein
LSRRETTTTAFLSVDVGSCSNDLTGDRHSPAGTGEGHNARGERRISSCEGIVEAATRYHSFRPIACLGHPDFRERHRRDSRSVGAARSGARLHAVGTTSGRSNIRRVQRNTWPVRHSAASSTARRIRGSTRGSLIAGKVRRYSSTVCRGRRGRVRGLPVSWPSPL